MLLQAPLLEIVLTYCGGSFTAVNTFLLCLGLPLFVWPLYLQSYLARPVPQTLEDAAGDSELIDIVIDIDGVRVFSWPSSSF